MALELGERDGRLSSGHFLTVWRTSGWEKQQDAVFRQLLRTFCHGPDGKKNNDSGFATKVPLEYLFLDGDSFYELANRAWAVKFPYPNRVGAGALNIEEGFRTVTSHAVLGTKLA